MKKPLADQISAVQWCVDLLDSTVCVRAALKDPTVPILADHAEGLKQALATLRALEPHVDEMREVIRKSRGRE